MPPNDVSGLTRLKVTAVNLCRDLTVCLVTHNNEELWHNQTRATTCLRLRAIRKSRVRSLRTLHKVSISRAHCPHSHRLAELETRQITLIEVVQSLGEYINDEDAKIRARAINYLTAVISSLPITYLTRQQIQVLCDFLCARVEDGGATDGLSKLQALSRFTKDMAQTAMKA